MAEMYKLKCSVFSRFNLSRSRPTREFHVQLPVIPREGEHMGVFSEDALFKILDVVYYVREDGNYEIELHVEEN